MKVSQTKIKLKFCAALSIGIMFCSVVASAQSQSILEKENRTRGIGFFNSEGERVSIERLMEDAKKRKIISIGDLLIAWDMMSKESAYERVRGMCIVRAYIQKNTKKDVPFTMVNNLSRAVFPYDLKSFREDVLTILKNINLERIQP